MRSQALLGLQTLHRFCLRVCFLSRASAWKTGRSNSARQLSNSEKRAREECFRLFSSLGDTLGYSGPWGVEIPLPLATSIAHPYIRVSFSFSYLHPSHLPANFLVHLPNKSTANQLVWAREAQIKTEAHPGPFASLSPRPL